MKTDSRCARTWLVVGSAFLLMSGCGMLGARSREERILAGLGSADQAEKRDTLLGLEGDVTRPVRDAVERILATDVDPATRAFAADALGRLGRWASTLELRRSAREDSDGRVRARALRAMIEILGGIAAEDLEYSLKNDPDAGVRLAAIQLAAKALEGKPAALLMVEGLRDEAPEVKLGAYLALRDITRRDIPPSDHDRWRECVDEM